MIAVATLVQAALDQGRRRRRPRRRAAATTPPRRSAGSRWALTALGLWLGVGLPLAHSLARGGGWMSWFRTTTLPSLRGALAAGEAAREPSGAGRAVRRLDALARPGDRRARPSPTCATRPAAGRWSRCGGRPARPRWRSRTTATSSDPQRGHRHRRCRSGPGARTGRRHRRRARPPSTGVAGRGRRRRARATTCRGRRRWATRPTTATRACADSDPARTAFAPLPTSEDEAVRAAPRARRRADDAVRARAGRRGSRVRRACGSCRRRRSATSTTPALGAAADLALLLGLGAASRLRTSTRHARPDLRAGARRPSPGRSAPSTRCSATGTSTTAGSTSGGRSSPAAPRAEDAPPRPPTLVEGERVAARAGLGAAVAGVAARRQRHRRRTPSAAVVAPYTPTVRTRRRRDVPADERPAHRRHPLPPRPARLSAWATPSRNPPDEPEPAPRARARADPDVGRPAGLAASRRWTRRWR